MLTKKQEILTQHPKEQQQFLKCHTHNQNQPPIYHHNQNRPLIKIIPKKKHGKVYLFGFSARANKPIHDYYGYI